MTDALCTKIINEYRCDAPAKDRFTHGTDRSRDQHPFESGGTDD